MTAPCITLVIPVYMNGPAILPILEALDKLNDRENVKEIWILGSPGDPTYAFVEQHRTRSGYQIRSVYLNTDKPMEKKNHGLMAPDTRFTILMHGDSLVLTENSYANFLAAFEKNTEVVVATSILTNPKWAYDRYGFWEKCMLARGIGIDGPTHMGNFNMFDRKLLIDRVGLFDEAFAAAGDDNDMEIRIVQSGLKIAVTDNRIVHLHPVAAVDACKCVLSRERCCSESYGLYFRKHGPAGYLSIQSFLFTFFRPALVLALFVPYLYLVSAALIAVYAFAYTGLVYREEWRDRRILILPFLNVYLLFLGTVYTAKGFFSYRPPPDTQSPPDNTY